MTTAGFKFDRVMIIDDNRIDLYISSRLITRSAFGAQVLSYTNPMEALEYLQDNIQKPQEWPQVIFVDIYMPLMSGFEFMDAYDRLPSSLKNSCKVYIISSSIDENDIIRVNTNKNIIAFQGKPLERAFLNAIDP